MQRDVHQVEIGHVQQHVCEIVRDLLRAQIQGATGALLTVKALYELERIGGKYALVTMCIGGGQGIAAVYERMH